MDKKKVLTAEELEKFVAARTNYYQLREHLADITITEERLKTDKQTTLINLDVAHNELAVVQKEIHDKYGEGRINMQTGEIS